MVCVCVCARVLSVHLCVCVCVNFVLTGLRLSLVRLHAFIDVSGAADAHSHMRLPRLPDVHCGSACAGPTTLSNYNNISGQADQQDEARGLIKFVRPRSKAQKTEPSKHCEEINPVFHMFSICLSAFHLVPVNQSGLLTSNEPAKIQCFTSV